MNAETLEAIRARLDALTGALHALGGPHTEDQRAAYHAAKAEFDFHAPEDIVALLDEQATTEARIELKDSQIDQLMRTLKDWQGHINQLEAALRDVLDQWTALDIALTLQAKESGIASLSLPIADQRHKMLMVADIARAALQGAADARDVSTEGYAPGGAVMDAHDDDAPA